MRRRGFLVDSWLVFSSTCHIMSPISRHVGETAVSAFNDRIHWLDNGSEHPHRVAFSVDNSILDQVLRHLEEGFKNARVQVTAPPSPPELSRFLVDPSRLAGLSLWLGTLLPPSGQDHY